MTRKLALAGAVVLLGVSLAGATTLLRMDFEDLRREADAIVIGTVTAVDGEWDPSLNFIHSNVTLRVERALLGQPADTIVLRTPGGTIGGSGQIAHGAAAFEVGERVLVFLTAWEDGTPKVLGYAQGKSRVVPDDRQREWLEGGSANGMSVEAAAREIAHGPDVNIPLRPAS